MRRLASMLAGLLLLPGCAHEVGKEAASGAVTGLREEDLQKLGDRMGHQLAAGLVDELSKPQQEGRISTLASAAMTGVLDAATGRRVRPQGVGGSGATVARRRKPGAAVGGTGVAARSPASLLSRQVGAGLADSVATRLEEHLDKGQGPLAVGLSATARDLSGSLVKGAMDQAATAFPQCQGENRNQCLAQQLQLLSHDVGKQAARGAWEGLGLWPVVVSFALGVLITALLAWALAMTRSLHRLRVEYRDREATTRVRA